MLGPGPKHESLYRRNLKQIAKMGNYQPIASIPQPSLDFNYTLVKNRYSDYYENPRVVRKMPNKSSEQVKLATILETHGRSPLFPKIAQSKKGSGENVPSSPKRKVKGLRAHFTKEQDTTEASRQRSLTIDTRLDTESDALNRSEIEGGEESVHVFEKKPRSLGFQTADRQNLQSNNSELSSLISRRRPREFSLHNRSEVVPAFADQILNQQEYQSDGSEQFQKNAVPGPGSYDFSYSDFDKKRSTRSTNVSFLSKLTRFDYSAKPEPSPPPKVENPAKVELEANREKRIKDRLKKRLVPFNSKSPRKFECDELAKNQAPGPQNYYPRQGIEEELIRNIQRQFKGSFGSNEPRFIQPTPEYPNIGPGSYDKPAEEDPLANQNFYFKSRVDRFPE